MTTQETTTRRRAVLAMSLAGWWLLTVLQRRRGDERRVWTIVAATVLVLSLSGPLVAEADTDVKVYLTLIHLAVGLVLIPGLRAAVVTSPSERNRGMEPDVTTSPSPNRQV